MNTPGDLCADAAEYLGRFSRRAAKQRVPVAGSFDLTRRCNLRCVHCYAGPARGRRASTPGELTTRQALRIVDQMAAAGCLFLLLSGGEPLLRGDFRRLYRRVKERGMLPTLFTNATLVTEPLAGFLADWPPQNVEVSLYGATAPTHDAITGRKGSFERSWRGIERLRARGVSVRIKTMLMTLNRHEYRDMERMAAARGLRFRSDPALFPRLDGDRTPLALRVTPAEAASLELANPEAAEKWRAFDRRIRSAPSRGRKLYRCGAGVTSFYVDPQGTLQPCLMTPHIRYDLLAGSFAEGWRDVAGRIAARREPPGYPCPTCGRRALCGSCPGFSLAENEREGVYSRYLCQLGERRLGKLEVNRSEEGLS